MVWLTDFKLRNDRANFEVEYVDNIPGMQREAWVIPPYLKGSLEMHLESLCALLFSLF